MATKVTLSLKDRGGFELAMNSGLDFYACVGSILPRKQKNIPAGHYRIYRLPSGQEFHFVPQCSFKRIKVSVRIFNRDLT